MSFIKATIEFKPASIGTGIKAQLRKSKKASAMLTLFISASRAAALSMGDGDGIEVMIGDGEHHGLVRLRKNNSAANAKAEKRETGKGAFFMLKLGHQAAFVDRSEPSAWCQWELVEDGWIEIVLPKWADETAPKKAREPVSAIAGKPQQPGLAVVRGAPGKSVTANLMGDPAPGRREMMQKMGEMKA